ncbi:hypothetical protein AGLY_001899 [Aphis glycines]|uniref:AAA-ATPase-like domain-containing protein n=1 Tax=Aphis glycines TaxID=307491 RepID=A0A6G0U472_APHGL|nr:hypothetical protein AGLY_001899 [Aphis glycines]
MASIKHFRGFARSFRMTYNATNESALICLREMNDNRKEIDIQIAEGTITKLDMMHQLKIEMHIIDLLLKKIDDKINENKCSTLINNAVKIVTERVNDLRNTVYLFFNIEDEEEPEFLKISNILKIRCSYCYDCNASIQIISNEENASFNFSSSDFIKILQTTGFIDKTSMIRKVFENIIIQGRVILAPRKYGKSTNLTMLKYFLEIQVDSLGNPISKADSETPITDTSNYELFRNLKISRETKIMNQHFGKYPVLYAKLKTKDEINSYSEAIDEAKEIIHKSFELHSYLKKSTKLSNKQRAISKFWCDGTRYKMAVFDDVIIGLRSLCKFLSKHFNKPCYVLIDDLDSFIVSDTDTTADTLVEEYRCIFSFLKQFLLFLNNKKYVFQAFMTGKSSLAIHGILPVCIEMKQFYSCHEFTDYFGLTNDELEYLFRKPEFINIQITVKEVKAYYGAYNKFAVNEKRKNQIYCIWSILNVLKHKRLDNYWRGFGTFFCNFSNKHIKAIMEDLVMTEKDLDITLFNKPKLIALPIPPLIFKTTEDIYSNKSLEYFCCNMLDLGYLTCNKAPLVIQVSTTDETNFTANLRIPNEEVRHDIKNKLPLLS